MYTTYITSQSYITETTKKILLLLCWWSGGGSSPSSSGTAPNTGRHHVRCLLHTFLCSGRLRRMGPTRIGVNEQAGSWLQKQVRIYSAISRATARPSVSKRSKMAASTCCRRSAVESNAGRTAPSEGGASATWMGLSPRASRRGSLH
jgi:hypothetical protein